MKILYVQKYLHTYPLVHFNKYLLRGYCVYNTVLGAVDIAYSRKTDMVRKSNMVRKSLESHKCNKKKPQPNNQIHPGSDDADAGFYKHMH